MILYFLLGFLIGCLLIISLFIWDLYRWGEITLDITMDEITQDLWNGLHKMQEELQ